MTFNAPCDFVLSLDEAACGRLSGVSRQVIPLADGGALAAVVALPASHAKKKNRRYPLLIVGEAEGRLGSVIEMSRLMAETGEVRECIVVAVPGRLDAAQLEQTLLPWCRTELRIDPDAVLLFDAAAKGMTSLPLPAAPDAQLPALLQGLRQHWATGRVYGSNVTALRHPMLQGLMVSLAPLFKRLRKVPAADAGNRFRLHCAAMARDFEVFITLPKGFDARSTRRYPALVVLDANIEFSTAAETAARLAASGDIEELIVIGIGVPRSEGHLEFAFRRFEEFSPPVTGYDWNDDLGRIFRALFAVRGQDARAQMGMAPALLRFIGEQLLPLLMQRLPIDNSRLGLLGHSAGGTFVGYALHQPESPFAHYFAVSPGIGISDSWLLRQPVSAPLAAAARTLVLSLGGEEKTNLFNRIAGIHETETYGQRLRAQAAPIVLHFDCFAGETHSSTYPGAVAQALRASYARAPATAALKLSAAA
ncbi:MAG: alpha/beta hydrolase-fold protein [Pseudomonadota bacterium]